ncbi:MAG: restriction endonuclease subunit S [Candidatus Omnitrophota bacterium]|nr:restriction endonuclease subunit S [Candidatus Omnitrophota bacterium]
MKEYISKFSKLDDIGRIARGKSKHRPRNDPVLYGGKYPFIQTGDVKHSHFYITGYSQTYNEKGLAQSRLWQPGTLCITIAANIADTAILKIPACFPDSIIGFIPHKKKADTHFVKYCLDTYKLQIQSISQGTTQDNLSLEKLRSINFKIPPLHIQKKIAAVLSTYDDLIENNNRRIAILEKMAEEIYREWFVRMRFPGHEKVKFHKGVPEGWEVEKVGNFINLIMGQSPKSEFYNTKGEGLPFNQGVGTYGYRFPKKQTFCSVNGRTAKKGDILFSVRAPVGRLNVADCKMIIGRGLSSINHKNGYNSYLYYMLKCYFSNEDIIGNGAIFNSVGKDELKKLEIIYPEESLIKQYNHIAVGLDLKIENLLNSIDLLVKSRDLLLSRLLFGKLSVENLDIKFPPGMEETDA